MRADCPPEDELMLDHFGQALAVALENHRLYSLEHQIALTLQRAMLPPSIPRSDFVELAVRYEAASDAVEVGGDFYEALSIAGDRVTMVAVGDVVGHSLHAATVMAELRHTLRAYAALVMPMPEILERLGAMLRDTHPGVTATLCIAEIDDAGTARIANAGHLPPVLRDADGTRLITEHGPLLGLRAGQPVPVVELPFGPGSVLLFASDGLVERRDEDIDIGMGRLRAAVAEHEGDADSLCDHVLDDVGAGEHSFDDVAILVARGRGVRPRPAQEEATGSRLG
jgi:serine phosphatase RsbU (regulator of sigma subunit)